MGLNINDILAIEILGWRSKVMNYGGGHFTVWLDKEDKMQKYKFVTFTNTDLSSLFRPLEHLDDAMMLLDQLMKDGYEVYIHISHKEKSYDIEATKGNVYYKAVAHEFNWAIVKLCLTLKGYDIDEIRGG